MIKRIDPHMETRQSRKMVNLGNVSAMALHHSHVPNLLLNLLLIPGFFSQPFLVKLFLFIYLLVLLTSDLDGFILNIHFSFSLFTTDFNFSATHIKFLISTMHAHAGPD